MIPYFEIPALHLGPIEIHAFGVLTVIAIWVGGRLATRRAASLGLDVLVLQDLWTWLFVGAWLGAHFFHVFLYHPEELRTDPLAALKLWKGFSSFGGVVGAAVATAIFLRRRKLPFVLYTEALVFGLGPGWFFGRLGCFTAHDHPGVKTDFPLAVAFPGGARHDLGFYEAILLAVISVVIVLMVRARSRPGAALGTFIVIYTPARFFLDFLRASDGYADGRYGGLTPAQILAVPLFAMGVLLLWKSRAASLTAGPAALA